MQRRGPVERDLRLLHEAAGPRRVAQGQVAGDGLQPGDDREPAPGQLADALEGGGAAGPVTAHGEGGGGHRRGRGCGRGALASPTTASASASASPGSPTRNAASARRAASETRSAPACTARSYHGAGQLGGLPQQLVAGSNVGLGRLRAPDAGGPQVLGGRGDGPAPLGQRAGQAGVEGPPLGERAHVLDGLGHDGQHVGERRREQAGGPQLLDGVGQRAPARRR